MSPLSSFAASKWIDFEIENGLITLPVVVSGIHGKAIIDTGAQVNAINQSFIDRYHLELNKGGTAKVTGVYGEELRTYYNDVPTKLFDAGLELDQLTSMRIGHYSNILLLGGGFLKEFIFQIDYPNSRMRLFKRDSLDLYRLKNIKAQIDRGSKHPVVKVNLNNEKDVWLVLDTGNSGGIFLKRSAATSEGWLEKFVTKSTLVQGVLDVGQQEVFALPEVTFGPFVLENVAISVPMKGQSENISTSHSYGKNVKGLLGYDVLKHFVLTIDYKTGYMHVGLPEES